MNTATDRHEGDMEPYCRAPQVLKFQAKKGDAILWFNHHMDLAQDFEALHGGCPVHQGEKWIMQRWFRWYLPSEGNEFAELLSECGAL